MKKDELSIVIECGEIEDRHISEPQSLLKQGSSQQLECIVSYNMDNPNKPDLAEDFREYPKVDHFKENPIIGIYRGMGYALSEEEGVVELDDSYLAPCIESLHERRVYFIPERMLNNENLQDLKDKEVIFNGENLDQMPVRNAEIYREGQPCGLCKGGDTDFLPFRVCPDCHGEGTEREAYKIYEKNWNNGNIQKSFPSEHNSSPTSIRGLYEGQGVPPIENKRPDIFYLRIDDHDSQRTFLVPDPCIDADSRMKYYAKYLHKPVEIQFRYHGMKFGCDIQKLPEEISVDGNTYRVLPLHKKLNEPIRGIYRGDIEHGGMAYHKIERPGVRYLIPGMHGGVENYLYRRIVEYDGETIKPPYPDCKLRVDDNYGTKYYYEVPRGELNEPIRGTYFGDIELDGKKYHQIGALELTLDRYLVSATEKGVDKNLLLRRVEYDGKVVTKAPEVAKTAEMMIV